VGIRKTNAVEVSLLNEVTSKPGLSLQPWDESGGCPVYWPGGVRHRGDVSLVCCSRTERGKACPDTAALVWRGEREYPEWLQPRGIEYRCVDAPADRLVVVVNPL